MGWNWIRSLSGRCRLTVITEKAFAEGIARRQDAFVNGYVPEFHYVDAGEPARQQFWNQGDWRFYRHYRCWQQQAHLLAKQLTATGKYDLVHQLNMIGYREPGYLWRLPLPFVWGPIGGHAQMPWRFLAMLSAKSAGFYCCRNVLNAVQMRMSRRVASAIHRADALIAATLADQAAIQRIHGRESFLINETGAASADVGRKPMRDTAQPLKIVWCGKFIGLKGMPLALHAISEARSTVPLEIHVVGSGPEERRWKKLAAELSVDDLCRWHGTVDHAKALELIGKSDCMLFTSVQEGTPHVVLEALAHGTPVICHDSCGHGACVTEACGIKVPVVSPRRSIEGFAGAIVKMGSDPVLLSKLSEGAIARASELSWDSKARQMIEVYRQVLQARAGSTLVLENGADQSPGLS